MNDEYPISENDQDSEPTDSHEFAQEEISAEPAPEVLSKDVKNLAMLCHLLSLFTGIIGPLIIWILKKDDHPCIESNGRKAINFQITVAIALMCCVPLTFIVIGIFLMPIIYVINIIFVIIATVKTSEGKDYTYPFTLNLIS